MPESETEVTKDDSTEEEQAAGEPEPETTADADRSIAASLLGTIAGRSEEAVKRVVGDLSENPRMQEAKERIGNASHSVLTQLNIASQDDVAALKDEIARLEQRLAVLEKSLATRSRSTPKAAPAED